MTSGSSSRSDQAAGFYRTRVGAFTVVALHEGTVSRDRGDGFIRNAPAKDVEAAFSAIGLAPGKLTLTFTSFLIETDDNKRVLIDTGFGESGPPTAGRLRSNLAAAGYAPGDIDVVLISHFHGDHITGLVDKESSPIYPNAQVMVPRPEWDFWMDDEAMAGAAEGLQPNFKLARRVFGALEGRFSKFDWGDEVVPGVTALQADGHTPGQTAFDIRSNDERLLFVADVSNNPTVFARFPTWQAGFDINGDRAVETRQRVFGEAADAKTRLAFYHAPFPALGYVARHGDGFVYIPQIWGADA